MFDYSQRRLFLQSGNHTVLISGIRSNSSVPTCPGQTGQHEQHISRVSRMKRCQIEEFNHLVSCNLTSDNTCSFKFPTNCNSTLGERVVEFECNTDNVIRKPQSSYCFGSKYYFLRLDKSWYYRIEGEPLYKFTSFTRTHS